MTLRATEDHLRPVDNSTRSPARQAWPATLVPPQTIRRRPPTQPAADICAILESAGRAREHETTWGLASHSES